MRVIETELPGVLVVEPKVFGDARGWFTETYSVERYRAAGIALPFVQDNLSRSSRGILRGLHLQNPHAQGKLVWVPDGSVFDVALDVRVGSPTFGRWFGTELSSDNHRQLWIPPGFAHGFMVTSESCLFAYKCTDLYVPEAEIGVAWDDPAVGIRWPLADAMLSPKDRSNLPLAEIDPAKLPRYELGAGSR
jgi:dTDP-4-dehydrorhamnose 3,5-epimerase